MPSTLSPANSPLAAERPFPAAAPSRFADGVLNESWLLRLTLLGVLIVYLQTALFDFVYDDSFLVLLNPWMHGGFHLREIFTSSFWAFDDYAATAGGSNFYRPLTMMWLVLMNAASKGAPGWFHLGVVAMHGIVVAEVYLLGRRLTGNGTVGALAAFLFAIHPTHIESVAWISGISDVQCTAFLLAALLCYLRWDEDRSPYWLGLTLLFQAMALLSKETGAILAVLIVVDQLWKQRKASLATCVVHALYLSLPFLALTGLLLALRGHVLAAEMMRATRISGDPVVPWSDGLKLFPYVTCWYLKKQILVLPVSTHYPSVFVLGFAWWKDVVSALALAILGYAAWRWCKMTRTTVMLSAFFVLTLAPVVGAVSMLQLHDRYLYTPGVPLAIAAAMLFSKWVGEMGRGRHLRATVVLLLCASLTAIACDQTRYWKNDIRLFEHSARVEPEVRLIWSSLAFFYQAEGRSDATEAALWQAVRQQNQGPQAYQALADFYLGEQQYDKAEAAAWSAFSRRPMNLNFSRIFPVLAECALHKGNKAEAELWARRAVAADYYSKPNRFCLLMVLRKTNPAAIQEFPGLSPSGR